MAAAWIELKTGILQLLAIRSLRPVMRMRILKNFVRALIWHTIHYFLGESWTPEVTSYIVHHDISWRHHRPPHVFSIIFINWGSPSGLIEFLRPLFKANHPVFPLDSDFGALLKSPIVLNDVDEQNSETAMAFAKSHEVSHFSSSAGPNNRFSPNFDLFILS